MYATEYNVRVDKPEPGQLIWERLSRASGKRPTLDYPGIVQTAIGIADREGLDAVSMRRIAQELGAGTMSLYRYITGKEELYDLMLDNAYGEMEVPERATGSWRTCLARLARQTRAVLKRHPWLAPLLTSRPTLGPNYLRWFEVSLGAAAKLRPEMRSMMRVVGTINAYVAGFAGYETGEAEANRRHGLSEEQKRVMVKPYLQPLLATGRFPNLSRFLTEGSGEPTDEDFEFGLKCVLDGLASALEKRSRT